MSETLDDLQPVSKDRPSEEVRFRILDAAHGKRIRLPIHRLIVQSIREFSIRYRPVWQTAFAAGLLFLFVFVIRPMVWSPVTDVNPVNLAWDDDFTTKALSIQSEIQTIQSGESLGKSIYSLMREIDEVDWAASSMDDFESIRDKMDALAESLSGL